jgi:phosphatidate phosphatase APP1
MNELGAAKPFPDRITRLIIRRRRAAGERNKYVKKKEQKKTEQAIRGYINSAGSFLKEVRLLARMI